MALDDDDAPSGEFLVFIEAKAPLSQKDADELQRLGVVASPGVSLVTGSVNQDGVARISELANVRWIKLSGRSAMRSAQV